MERGLAYTGLFNGGAPRVSKALPGGMDGGILKIAFSGLQQSYLFHGKAAQHNRVRRREFEP